MGKDKETTVTQTNTIDPSHLAKWDELYGQYQNLPGFNPYGGEFATGMTPDELAAGDMIRGIANGQEGMNAVRGGIDMFSQAAGYSPQQVQGGSYDPALSQGMGGFNPLAGGIVGAQGHAVQAQAAQAAQANAGQAVGDTNQLRGAVRDVAGQSGASAMNAYQNPYEQQVVDGAMGDLDRARQMVLGQNADRAAAAGAFGDDRHGIIDAEANRDFMTQVGQLSGSLRQSGFRDMVTAGQQDASRYLQAGQANQGADMSALGMGTNLGMNNAQMSTSANLANAQNALAASQATAGNRTQASIANAQNSVAGQGQNLQYAQMLQQNNQFNAGMQNEASQFGLNQNLQAGMANQNAGLTANGQLIGAGQGMVGAGGQLQNLGLGAAGALGNYGGIQRGINDATAAGAYQEFLRGEAYPLQNLLAGGQILGSTPYNTNAVHSAVEKGNLVNDLVGIGTTVAGIGGQVGWWGQQQQGFNTGYPQGGFPSGPGSPGYQWSSPGGNNLWGQTQFTGSPLYFGG